MPLFHKTHKFILMGGVGNQLFGYFAALSFAIENSGPVILDLSEIKYGMTQHNSSIESFALELPVLHPKRSKNFKRVSRLLIKLFGLVSRKFTFQPNEVGYIPNLERINASRISGYFQTWKYFDYVKQSGNFNQLKLLNPSDWYLELSARAIATKPIMMHIRRGDYLKLENSIGVLSDSYFEKALSLLPIEIQKKEIWIFTDSPDAIQEIVYRPIFSSAQIIIPPSGADPSESLMLMSLGCANIISNSTFSWWGAFLNSYSKITVAPSKWFKGLADPRDLIPTEWLKCESEWTIHESRF